MTSDTFLDRLEAAALGKLSKTEVLEPFLDGLEKFLADFGDSLDRQPEEMRDFLAAYIEAIEDGAETCEELAIECLDQGASEDSFLELADAHTHLNRLLLDFHSESWVFRGPTKVDWINMVVDGGERFLQGGSFPRYLSALLDEHVRDLELKLACRPALEGEALIKVARQLANWARGEDSLSRHQLEDLMTKLIGYGERFADYLTKRTASLEQLLASLGGSVPAEEILWMLDGVLTELQRIRGDFEAALAASQLPQGQEISKVLATLGELESAISALAEQGSGDLEEADVDDLHELHEMLENEIATFQRAANREAPVKCSACGQGNPPRRSQCASCSAPLASETNRSNGTLDFSETEQVPGEEEHVARMRIAMARFRDGSLGFERFRSEVQAAQDRFETAIRRFKSVSARTDQERQFMESLDQLEHALDLLAQVSSPEQPELEEGQALFLAGVSRFREASNAF
jgi:uncharacterized OB-fold protein